MIRRVSLVQFFFLTVVLLTGCSGNVQREPEKDVKKTILPLQLTLKGQLHTIEDVGLSYPPIHFRIGENKVEVTVGRTEHYELDYQATSFREILEQFSLEDFKSNAFYFNPSFQHMGYLETRKTIDGESYTRKFSNFRRRDIPIEYLELTEAERRKFTLLSDHANELAIALLRDSINKDSMLTARLMEEALRSPEKVYKLSLRNTRTSVLSPDVGRLVNLRVLDISGSRIRRIPPEIGNCVHLRSIIANASPLSEIPSTIGKLRHLRNVNFGYCRLEAVPEELGEVESLWTVNLGSNQIRELPASIAQLKNVLFFAIDKNEFRSFPEPVLGLKSVVNLWVHGNYFTTLPTGISRLRDMSHLLVDAHEIENLAEIHRLLPDVRIIDEEKR